MAQPNHHTREELGSFIESEEFVDVSSVGWVSTPKITLELYANGFVIQHNKTNHIYLYRRITDINTSTTENLFGSSPSFLTTELNIYINDQPEPHIHIFSQPAVRSGLFAKQFPEKSPIFSKLIQHASVRKSNDELVKLNVAFPVEFTEDKSNYPFMLIYMIIMGSAVPIIINYDTEFTSSFLRLIPFELSVYKLTIAWITLFLISIIFMIYQWIAAPDSVLLRLTENGIVYNGGLHLFDYSTLIKWSDIHSLKEDIVFEDGTITEHNAIIGHIDDSGNPNSTVVKLKGLSQPPSAIYNAMKNAVDNHSQRNI